MTKRRKSLGIWMVQLGVRACKPKAGGGCIPASLRGGLQRQ